MFNDYFNRVGFMWLCFMYLHFFVLIQKNKAKKIKTVPASLKKLTLD